MTTKKDKMKLLFVCLGNICRSPAAEGIMKRLVGQAGLDHRFEIDSAAIGPWHVGELPDRRMRRHGAAHGYDFSSRARQISPADFGRFDRIIVMDEDNYRAVSRMASHAEERAKIYLMTEWMTHHPSYKVVPDPYYGGDEGFELVIELLEDACQGLLHELC